MRNCGVGFADGFSETNGAVTSFPHPNAVIARSAGVAIRFPVFVVAAPERRFNR